jgi:hypothetical protein
MLRWRARPRVVGFGDHPRLRQHDRAAVLHHLTGHTRWEPPFAAAVNALHWVEVDQQSFGAVRRFRDDEILRIGVGMVPSAWYRVRVGRVREWEGKAECWRPLE